MIRKKAHAVFLVLNIVLLILAMACLDYYDKEGGLWLKGVTSSWFVVIGGVNLLYAAVVGRGCWGFLLLTELALVLSMAADVLLGISFMTGVVVFALGHVSYFAAFCALEKLRLRDICLMAAIGAVSLYIVLCSPYIQVGNGTMKIMLAAYAVVISCMLGKALGNLLQHRSAARWLMALGAAMFWFSDLMLALNLFGRGGKTASMLCMYTYWPGQSILAHSLFYFIRIKKPDV